MVMRQLYRESALHRCSALQSSTKTKFREQMDESYFRPISANTIGGTKRKNLLTVDMYAKHPKPTDRNIVPSYFSGQRAKEHPMGVPREEQIPKPNDTADGHRASSLILLSLLPSTVVLEYVP